MIIDIEYITPVTTEQRELIFSKMKEAGYEWDTEKKELKKIEQDSAWSEEDEKLYISALWHISNSCGNGCHDSGEYEVYNWLKSLKYRVQPQLEQEWSKEDSERLLRIHQFIWANRKGDTDEIYQLEQDADWLMSITPQTNQYDKGYANGYSAAKYNHWKPTDKQMEDFQMLLGI